MESTRQQIEDRAASFLQRRETGQWTDADRAELTAWLDSATAHRIAFLRTETAWEEMGRLKALGAGLSDSEVPTPEELDAAFFRKTFNPEERAPGPRAVEGSARRPAAYFSAAASFLLVLGGVVGAYQLWFAGKRYSTPVGGVASVALEDGSRVTLNTLSKLRVVLSETERRVDLSEGEAFFEVAPDPARPFIVQAGRRRVIAVGTKFSVRSEGNDVDVVVTEGKVRIENGDSARLVTPAMSGAHKSEVLVAAGSTVRAGDQDIIVRHHTLSEAEEILSWRGGYLVFHETPLADAVAEFNRYNERQITIPDHAVAAMKLSGKFRATNNETFVALLEEAYHVHAEHTSSAIVLTDTTSR